MDLFSFGLILTFDIVVVVSLHAESNLRTFQKYTAPNSSVQYHPYATLFGHSGIFESCSRLHSAIDTCNENRGSDLILRFSGTNDAVNASLPAHVPSKAT